MASDVEICNMALGSIGVSHEISDLNEGSDEADQCNRFYEITRDALLRSYPWGFAKRFFTLQLVEENPNDDWAYSYRYPNTCLRVRRFVIGDRSKRLRIPYTIAHDDTGKLIYCDVADAVIEMTARITNAEIFDAVFAEALAYRLGSRIAIPLSRDPKERQNALALYQMAISEAFGNDNAEETQDEPRDAESILARD